MDRIFYLFYTFFLFLANKGYWHLARVVPSSIGILVMLFVVLGLMLFYFITIVGVNFVSPYFEIIGLLYIIFILVLVHYKYESNDRYNLIINRYDLYYKKSKIKLFRDALLVLFLTGLSILTIVLIARI